MIFVDETSIQIDGKDYWLWVAYEPNIDFCLMVQHISRERIIFVYVIYSSKNTEEIWQKKTRIHR